MIGKISPAASPHPTVPRLWTSTRSGRDVNPAYCSEGEAQRGWASCLGSEAEVAELSRNPVRRLSGLAVAAGPWGVDELLPCFT